MDIRSLAMTAKAASMQLAAVGTEPKNRGLRAIAAALRQGASDIFRANEQDLRAARESNLAPSLLERLQFDAAKLDAAVAGVNSLVGLPDPVGVTLAATELDKGLELYRVTCPIGVIGVIFESRPDALVQISSLCLKSGNSVLLKGGHEALHTNRVLAEIIARATATGDIPCGWVHLLETRADVNEMLALDDVIDLVIPRGSNVFVKYIMEHSHIPVLGHADGICHVYVDQAADIDMALRICIDAKCQYVAVCNAAETILVHAARVADFLPRLKTVLETEHVRIVGCPATVAAIGVAPASEEDWRTEYLDPTVSIKIVHDLHEAIAHINTYGSGHTDSIVTNDRAAADMFMSMVDSGNVFWNCSTRFSDGYRYGLGAEVGISTSKIHARGPVGLDGLVIYKWLLKGAGHTVGDYTSGSRTFTHRRLPIGSV